MAAQHIVNFNFQVIPHASGVLILVNEGVQGVVFLRFFAERIAVRLHIFSDALCYVPALFQHFSTGKSFSKIKVYVHRQSRQIKNRQIDRRSAFQGKRILQNHVLLHKGKNIGETAYFLKGIPYKAKALCLTAKSHTVILYHGNLPPYPSECV